MAANLPNKTKIKIQIIKLIEIDLDDIETELKPR